MSQSKDYCEITSAAQLPSPQGLGPGLGIPLQLLVRENVGHACIFGTLRKGPPFHGSRSSREITSQNASCQMGGREVTR